MYNKIMKITVLVDNNSKIDNYLLSEPAFSLYIEHLDKKLLFDCGYSDVFIKNAEKLNIDSNKITDIILSHGHNDHTGGLRYLQANKNINLIAHPNIFDEKIDTDKSQYGCPISKAELEKKFNLKLTKLPFWITDDLCFLGQIENNNSDDIDDSALAYKTSKGLIIITGCSHSGTINIIKYAKKITNCDKIQTVFGGMHLLNKNQKELFILTDKLQKDNIKTLYPAHCCDLNSKIFLSRYFEIKEVCTGDIFEF